MYCNFLKCFDYQTIRMNTEYQMNMWHMSNSFCRCSIHWTGAEGLEAASIISRPDFTFSPSHFSTMIYKPWMMHVHADRGDGITLDGALTRNTNNYIATDVATRIADLIHQDFPASTSPANSSVQRPTASGNGKDHSIWSFPFSSCCRQQFLPAFAEACKSRRAFIAWIKFVKITQLIKNTQKYREFYISVFCPSRCRRQQTGWKWISRKPCGTATPFIDCLLLYGFC